MQKIIAIIVLALFGGISMISYTLAQTALEDEADGLSHFRRAFYEATPHKDHKKAAAEYQKAEKAFQKAIEKNHYRMESYLHLGRTYFVQKKYQRAARIYRKALRLEPEQKEIYLQLASTLEMDGDYAGAVHVLEQLRERETDERAIQILDDFIEKLESK